MKVQELIEKLQDLDPNLEVHLYQTKEHNAPALEGAAIIDWKTVDQWVCLVPTDIWLGQPAVKQTPEEVLRFYGNTGRIL